jgi:ATP diphosphatase
MKNINNNQKSVLDDIANDLPELQKAVELTINAAEIGFDWLTIEPVFLKMQEELFELKEAIEKGDPNLIKDELGDVLFVCCNLARHLKLNPESALAHANNKFENRFRKVEQLAHKNHGPKDYYDLNLLENLWINVKKEE